MDKRAPEIYQKAIADLDLTGLPPRDAPNFDQALLLRYAMDFAERGCTAVIVLDAQHVRVVAVPERGVEPMAYALSLLKGGFLEDALPILEALAEMLRNAEIEYNLGVCLSELGRIAESVKPLERCITLDPEHIAGLVGLGVAYARLGRQRDAERALREAVYQAPGNALAKRDLAAILGNAGRYLEALPLFRQAVSLAPNEPLALLGLAECLDALGDNYRAEADGVYALLARKFGEHPIVVRTLAARARGESDPDRPPKEGEVHGSDS